MTNLVAERRAPEWVSDLYIDGQAEPGQGQILDVLNPATERVLHSVAQASLDQVDAAVAAARRAFDRGYWSTMPGEERSKLLHNFADEFERLHDELSAGVVCEVGSPVTLATSLQTAVAVSVLRTYADLAARDRTVDLGADSGTIASQSVVAYRPMGVVAVITAYNLPPLIL